MFLVKLTIQIFLWDLKYLNGSGATISFLFVSGDCSTFSYLHFTFHHLKPDGLHYPLFVLWPEGVRVFIIIKSSIVPQWWVFVCRPEIFSIVAGHHPLESHSSANNSSSKEHADHRVPLPRDIENRCTRGASKVNLNLIERLISVISLNIEGP